MTEFPDSSSLDGQNQECKEYPVGYGVFRSWDPLMNRTVRETAKLLAAVGQRSDSSLDLVRELGLPAEEEEQVLLELGCLQRIAGHLSVVEAFSDSPETVEPLLTAYYEEWPKSSECDRRVHTSEEVYRRLPVYREAMRSADEEGIIVSVGKAFARLCGNPDRNLTGLGSNVFGSASMKASKLLEQVDLEAP